MEHCFGDYVTVKMAWFREGFPGIFLCNQIVRTNLQEKRAAVEK